MAMIRLGTRESRIGRPGNVSVDPPQVGVGLDASLGRPTQTLAVEVVQGVNVAVRPNDVALGKRV